MSESMKNDKRMMTPWTQTYEDMKRLHKVLTESMACVEKNINESTVEWLQLCSIVEMQKSTSDEIAPVDGSAVKEKVLLNMENSTLINVQPITLHIKQEAVNIKTQEEEFDSD